MQAELIFTGTELLLGEILNTHAQYLSQRLTAFGIQPVLHITVGDQWERLSSAIKESWERSDIVIVTGGLGPTTDDLTKETVAQILGVPMILDQPSLDRMREFFQRRGTSMPEIIVKQAYFPEGAKILPNPRGTAPGALFEKNGRFLFLLPGPPGELQAMFEESVASFLAGLRGRGMVTRSKIFKVTGISEAMVQQRLQDLGTQDNPGIAYVAKPGEVHVRISGRAFDPATAEQMVAELAEKVHSRLADFVFAQDTEVLEELVGNLLVEKGMTIALAESCTGGLIASRLTDIAGSSRYFLGGIVAYDNSVKEKLLGVPADTLENYGAVSKETAISMASGVRDVLHADLGLGVTGIAGPTGGTAAKPVGLVYIALNTPDGITCREYRFPGERPGIRWGTANAALNMVRLYLLGTLSLQGSCP